MDEREKRRILAESRRLCEPIDFEPRPIADPQDDPLVRYQQRCAETEAAIVRKGFAEQGESEAAAAGAERWNSWLRAEFDAERAFMCNLIGEWIGEQLAESRRAFERSLDRQRELFAAELRATSAELRARVAEIASDMHEARRALDTELKAQCKAIQLENIDRCQALVDRLQTALGGPPVIDSEAERQRRPN